MSQSRSGCSARGASRSGYADESARGRPAAICLVGGVSIVALRRIPIVVLTAGIAAVVLLVFAGSRLALRAGRKWTPVTYLKAAALASGALAVCVGLGYMLWVMICDC